MSGGGGTPGTPPPPGIASTCYGYAAGGMPLAFTQEDFLVPIIIGHNLYCNFILFSQVSTEALNASKILIC